MAQSRGKSAGSKSDVRQAQKQSFADRSADTRDEIERFLIVCEGKQTEPNYFRSFRVRREVVAMDIRGEGYNTLSLVKQAVELRDSARGTPDAYDQVWCVFDRDSFPAEHFNAAIQYAKSADVHVAYSNEAFEIWYLLHFHYHDAAMSRQAYRDKLTQSLEFPYEKNSRTIYEALVKNQKTAIENAKKLHRRYNPHYPEKDNPCTTVYLLVEELNKYLI